MIYVSKKMPTVDIPSIDKEKFEQLVAELKSQSEALNTLNKQSKTNSEDS